MKKKYLIIILPLLLSSFASKFEKKIINEFFKTLKYFVNKNENSMIFIFLENYNYSKKEIKYNLSARSYSDKNINKLKFNYFFNFNERLNINNFNG